MICSGKITQSSLTHHDYYIYSQHLKIWIKVWCTLSPDMTCTAPQTYSRGQITGKNFKQSGKYAQLMLNNFENLTQQLTT